MASPFLKYYKGQQEQARVKETSCDDPQSLPGLVLCVGPGGLNIGRITTYCDANGTRNQKLDPNFIQLPKWNAAIPKKLPLLRGKASCPKNSDIETSLCLAQPGVGKENDAKNKSVVFALPAQTSLASSSQGPNLGNKVNEHQPITMNDQSKLVFMDAFLNSPRKRARMNY